MSRVVHVPPKDSLVLRLTFLFAHRQIARRMKGRSPFSNKRSDDSDLA